MTPTAIDRQWQRWKLKIQKTGLGCRITRSRDSALWKEGHERQAHVVVMLVESQLVRDVTDIVMLRNPRAVSKTEERRDEAALNRLRRKCG